MATFMSMSPAHSYNSCPSGRAADTGVFWTRIGNTEHITAIVQVFDPDTPARNVAADALVDEAMRLGKTMIGKYLYGLEATSFHLKGVYLLDACYLANGSMVVRVALYQ